MSEKREGGRKGRRASAGGIRFSMEEGERPKKKADTGLRTSTVTHGQLPT